MDSFRAEEEEPTSSDFLGCCLEGFHSLVFLVYNVVVLLVVAYFLRCTSSRRRLVMTACVDSDSLIRMERTRVWYL